MAHSTEYAHLEADAQGVADYWGPERMTYEDELNAFRERALDGRVFGTRDVGSRYATRVRVASPQGSAFDGRRGIVVRDVPGSTTLMVRLDNPPGVRGPESTLPFGRGELVTE